ncbi:C3HC zinc finger-like-domain-containing protein [Thermothelomyces heterothallicus CBS 202.75]|uniref:C3HC zinc finger-like-domain-containing protein n=1 Tax=Thermothelomyces heterothallicus CBS 202.75 TaxID=1149848 RepID=UPI003744266F
MNSTVKRKFNALLQGIGNQLPSEYSSDRESLDPASSPLSQRSSPHPSRTMAGGDSSLDLQKRRRLGEVTTTTTTPSKYATLQTTPMRSSPASIRSVPPAITTTTTVSNVTLRKWTPGSASPAPDPRDGLPPPPKYCPGDRDQLLRRLATFQELTDWAPKPDRVNEVEWARRGWVCQGKERVKCVLCGRELAVKVNRKEVDGKEIAVLIASEVAESVVDTYVRLIVEAHAEDCLWRKRGCDDSLLRLPLPNPKLALQGLRQRYDELCERAAFLPYEFNLRLPPGLDLDAVITYLPPTFFTDPPPKHSPAAAANNNKNNNNTNHQANPNPNSNPASTPSPAASAAPAEPTINRPALALALFGWQSLTHPQLGNPVPNSASCHTCLRRLGLWMFKSREVDPATGAVVVPAPMDHLDPLREHRFFCPWKNAAAQRNPGARSSSSSSSSSSGAADMAAWEVLVQGLRNEAFIRERISGAGSGSGSAAGRRKQATEKEGGRIAAAVLRGHGRSKSSVPTPGAGSSSLSGDGSGGRAGADDGVPKTPGRPATVGGQPRITVGDADEDYDGDGDGDGVRRSADGLDDEEARAKKDKDMMSRLRRVKSLFNAKTGSKLRRLGGSRPGTSHSNVGGGE